MCTGARMTFHTVIQKEHLRWSNLQQLVKVKSDANRCTWILGGCDIKLERVVGRCRRPKENGPRPSGPNNWGPHRCNYSRHSPLKTDPWLSQVATPGVVAALPPLGPSRVDANGGDRGPRQTWWSNEAGNYSSEAVEWGFAAGFADITNCSSGFSCIISHIWQYYRGAVGSFTSPLPAFWGHYIYLKGLHDN